MASQRGGIDAAALALDPGHESIIALIALATAEQQVLKQMRQTGEARWLVMASGTHARQRRRACRLRLMHQRCAQTACQFHDAGGHYRYSSRVL
jgi:hypothetical protein